VHELALFRARERRVNALSQRQFLDMSPALERFSAGSVEIARPARRAKRPSPGAGDKAGLRVRWRWHLAREIRGNLPKRLSRS
jgi:hypothetical protein